MVSGLIKLMGSLIVTPVNLGNPQELSMKTLAELIITLTKSTSPLTLQPLPEDDPLRRQPDITKAIKYLGWKPTTDIQKGLLKTIDYFKKNH
jgi:UDP-glucuronate decarboxylase